jgi:hypothetical protein
MKVDVLINCGLRVYNQSVVGEWQFKYMTVHTIMTLVTRSFAFMFQCRTTTFR